MFFLFHLDKNSGCYGNLQLPLTYNGKRENWHLLLSHCRYFDKILQKFSLSSPLPVISILFELLILIGCHGNQKAKFAKKI